MKELLTAALSPTDVTVEDTSGGCGAMYKIEIESPLFNGVNLVKQHRMVTETLKKEIGEMHGLTIHTRRSPE